MNWGHEHVQFHEMHIPSYYDPFYQCCSWKGLSSELFWLINGGTGYCTHNENNFIMKIIDTCAKIGFKVSINFSPVCICSPEEDIYISGSRFTIKCVDHFIAPYQEMFGINPTCVTRYSIVYLKFKWRQIHCNKHDGHQWTS